MIKRIQELKVIISERANYYSTIGFTNLAKEFTDVLNILNELENMALEQQELKAQIDSANDTRKTDDVLIGCIKQSEGDAGQ